MPPDATPLAPDRVLGGRYRLVRPLDRGGMAEVWEALDEVLDRPVAVKALLAHLANATTFLERFRREAVAAARLAHPNIVATFDTGTDGGTVYIVMELVRGRTLHVLLSEGRPSFHDAAAIAFQVADALEHAHRHGVIHRDIKPGNILICDEPGHLGPRVKVTDFGIAKLTADDTGDLTRTGTMVGTAKYLSPEQVQGGEPDARSDVYSLGIVLYEMVCGEPPFHAATDIATAMHHVRSEPAAPHLRRDGVPPALEALILRALAKDPAARPPSAAAFGAAVAAIGLFDDASPTVTRDPTPPAGVVASSGRRRRRPVFPALAVGAVMAAVVAVALVVVGFPGHDRVASLPRGSTISLARVTSFDPKDGSEKEELAHLATDGNLATSWETSHYRTEQFGGLKPGVGIVFVLRDRARVGALHLVTGGDGWGGEVYAADQPASALDGWGSPIAAVDRGGKIETVQLRGATAGAVLLWITDLGPARQFRLLEASVSAA